MKWRLLSTVAVLEALTAPVHTLVTPRGLTVRRSSMTSSVGMGVMSSRDFSCTSSSALSFVPGSTGRQMNVRREYSSVTLGAATSTESVSSSSTSFPSIPLSGPSSSEENTNDVSLQSLVSKEPTVVILLRHMG